MKMADLWTGWHGPNYILKGDVYAQVTKDKQYDLEDSNKGSTAYKVTIVEDYQQKIFPDYIWAKKYIEQSAANRIRDNSESE